MMSWLIPFIILVNQFDRYIPFCCTKEDILTKIIKGYISTKTSLTVHTVAIAQYVRPSCNISVLD